MAVGDIGIWTDSAGSQLPGTSFGTMDFATETLNQNSHYSEAAGVVTLNEAGLYLVIANCEYAVVTNRMTVEGQIIHTGTGDFMTMRNTGFGRNGANASMTVQAYGLVFNAGTGDTVAYQHRRDADNNGSGSVANVSTLTVIRLHDSASVGMYQDTSSTTDPSATTWADLSLNNNIVQNDTASIERTGNDITIKATARYLIGYGYSLSGFTGNNDRTQRLVRMESGGSALNASTRHEYMRDGDNEYCSPSGMILYNNSGSTVITMQGSRQGATVTGAGTPVRATSVGGVFVVELPSSAEVYIGVDGTAGQDIAATPPVDLNAMRTNTVIDTDSFSSSSNVDLTNNSGAALDALVWCNAWATRTASNGTRLSRRLVLELNGTNRTRGRYNAYNRGTQSGDDCPDSAHCAMDVIDSWPNGQALNVETFDLGDDGNATPTIANQVGFFAINLDTLEAAAGGGTVTASLSGALEKQDLTSTASLNASLVPEGAAWAAALNTPIEADIAAGNVEGRTRIAFDNIGDTFGGSPDAAFRYEYRKAPAGSPTEFGAWAVLNASSSSIRTKTTTDWADGDDCDENLLGVVSELITDNNAAVESTGAFVMTDELIGGSPTPGVESEINWEVVAADCEEGEEIELRIVWTNYGSPDAFDQYDHYPRIIITSESVEYTITASLQAALEAQDLLSTASLSGALQTTDIEITADLNAALALGVLITASLDGNLAGQTLITAALNAILQKLDETITSSLSAALSIANQTATASLNASLHKPAVSAFEFPLRIY